MTCENCRYHVEGTKNEQGDLIGFCHRGPPQLVAPNQSQMPPVSSEKTWCGEFRRKGWFK